MSEEDQDQKAYDDVHAAMVDATGLNPMQVEAIRGAVHDTYRAFPEAKRPLMTGLQEIMMRLALVNGVRLIVEKGEEA